MNLQISLVITTALSLLFLSSPLLAKSESVSKNILYIGDSHSCMDFGNKLDELLRNKADLKLTRIASGGSATGNWLNGTTAKYEKKDGSIGYFGYCQQEEKNQYKSPKGESALPGNMQQLITRYKPSEFIIALGSNGETPKHAEEMISLLKNKGVKCQWVLPPVMFKIPKDIAEEREKIIQDANANNGHYCKIVESRKAPVMSKLTKKDFDKELIHINNKNHAADKWAQYVFDEINKNWTSEKTAPAPNISPSKTFFKDQNTKHNPVSR